MSVLVKRMNMPVSCYECPMAEEMDMQEDWYKCKLLKKHFYSWDVTEDMEEYHRPKECPLVEVPTPHGSLIDSEELSNMLALGVMTAQMLGSDENTSLDIHFMKEILKEMPTVIEAEE